MKDGMLFCEHCGEEIRIVQDFEPEIGGIVTGFEDASNLRQEKVNTQIREGPGKAPASPGQDAVSPEQDSGHAVSRGASLGKRKLRRKRRMAGMAAGLGALLLICLLAAAGTLLKIKPVLSFTRDGKLTVVDKCKGMKKAFAYALAKMEKFNPVEENRMIWIVHTDAEAQAQELADMIEARWKFRPDVTIMGPVIGSHVGPGSVSVIWRTAQLRQD